MTLRAQRVVAGAIVLTLACAFGVLLYRLTNPSTGTYKVRLTLRDADGLHKDSDVKIGGVPAGVITSLKVVHRARGVDVAVAELALEKDAGPIGTGAKARVRPVNLLGEKYLDLTPGDLTRAQPSGSSIPMSRTSSTVGLDDVLNALDADTRTRVGILVNETGVALTGRASAFRGVLSRLPSGLGETREVLAEIARQDGALRRLITDSSRVLEPLAEHRDDLADLVTEAQRTLTVTASRQQALGQTLAEAPAGLAELRRTLSGLGRTADGLRPAAADLQRVAAPLTSTLRAVPGFATAARQALSTAQSVSPTITKLAVEAEPTVARLQPTIARVNRVLAENEPTVRGLARENGAKTLLYFLQTWARVVKSEDGLGHLFGAALTIDTTVFGAVLDRLNQTDANTPAKRGRRTPAKRPATKPVAQPAPTPPARLTSPVERLPEAIGGVVQKLPEVVTGVVGKLLGGGGGGGGQGGSGSSSASGPGDSKSALGVLDYLLGE